MYYFLLRFHPQHSNDPHCGRNRTRTLRTCFSPDPRLLVTDVDAFSSHSPSIEGKFSQILRPARMLPSSGLHGQAIKHLPCAYPPPQTSQPIFLSCLTHTTTSTTPPTTTTLTPPLSILMLTAVAIIPLTRYISSPSWSGLLILADANPRIPMVCLTLVCLHSPSLVPMSSNHPVAPELTHAGFNPQGQAGYAGVYNGQGIAQSPVSGYVPSGLPIPVAHHGHIPHGSITHGQSTNSFPGGHSVAPHHGHSYYHAQPSSQYTLHPVGHQAPSSSSSQPAQPIHRCDICDQTFTRAGDLKRHRDSVHSDRLHKCTICQKTYTRTDSLTRHMNDSHA